MKLSFTTYSWFLELSITSHVFFSTSCNHEDLHIYSFITISSPHDDDEGSVIQLKALGQDKWTEQYNLSLCTLTYNSNQLHHCQKFGIDRCYGKLWHVHLHSIICISTSAYYLLLTGALLVKRGRIYRDNTVIVNLKWIRQGQPVLRLQHKNQVMNKSQ